MTENYRGCYDYLSAQFEQVGGYEFYKELFPDNEVYGMNCKDFPIRVLCICIGERIRSSTGGKCMMIPGNRIIWILSREIA